VGESSESSEALVVPQKITATYTATGTYTWNSATDVLTWNFTTSNFQSCNGPPSTETISGVTITSTTMTWPNAGEVTGTDMIFTRSSGTADDIVGTWTSTNSTTGDLYTATFKSDSTVSIVGVVSQCISNNNTGNPYAYSLHWPNDYFVNFGYDDQSKTASSVSVTGPGISTSDVLGYDNSDGSWSSWTSPGTQIDFGTTTPTGLPFTYTFSITDATTSNTSTATATLTCFQEKFATNLSSTGMSTGQHLTFSWAGIGDSSAVYQVQLNDNNYNRVWDSNETHATAIVYGGPVLTSGTTYHYDVVVTSSSTCDQSSLARGNFVYP